jgi:hypothetical protein
MCKEYRQYHDECNHFDLTEVRPCLADDCRPGDDTYKVEYGYTPGSYCSTCMLGDHPPANHYIPNVIDHSGSFSWTREDLIFLHAHRENMEWGRNSEHIRHHPNGSLSLDPHDIYAFQDLPPAEMQIYRELQAMGNRLRSTLHARWASNHEPQPTREQIMLVLRLRQATLRLEVQIKRDLAEAQVVTRAASVMALFTPVPLESVKPEDMVCMICHARFGEENIVDGIPSSPAEKPVRLPCPSGHVFGHTCIKTWLLESSIHRCPYCQYDFAPLFPFSGRRRPSISEQEMQLILEMEQPREERNRNTPIPWWLKMLRGESYEND